MLALQSHDSDGDDVSTAEHHRLQAEEKIYRHKLQAFQEGQQRQAQLVQKLQAKVLQYKKRCGELEEQVLEKTSESEKLKLSLQAHLDTSAGRLRRAEQERSSDLQSKLRQLEEEQKRCAGLAQVNALLREQLEQAGAANQALTDGLRKARDEADQKDARMRREQEAASLRNAFTQLRASTDRSLSDMRVECVTVSRHLHVACTSLERPCRSTAPPVDRRCRRWRSSCGTS
ncbi:hypothetical protein ANANG_G00090060 [Anguilla anguilla]|uniref:Rootletin-like coiled-coil domain-containing protein n=1 Tax=Anguilla anguilla TaxID=7936 RepID=A0A9D3S5T6_ANGAN|nr:hypothetical protein ANANG_G00090060 [Anguilla anguilla]